MFNRILSFAVLLTSGMAHAESGWSGGGGEGLFTHDNIWNLGPAQISYCIKRSDDYPLAQSDLSNLVEESFNEWKAFLRKYDLHKTPLKFKLPLPVEEFLPAPSLNFKEVTNCDDSPSSKDIRFLFGIKNEVVTTFNRYSSAELKLGAALRPAYDHQSRTHGGYVWIENFSTSIPKIKHLVLHEIGHTLGMKHNSVFVMNENIGEVLTSSHVDPMDLGSIESEGWPFMMRQGDKVVLTSARGKIASNDHRETPCEARGHMPNRLLPPALARRMNLPGRGCHKIELEFLQETGNKSILKLTLSTLREVKFSWKGEFISAPSKRRESLFPGVYTRTKNGQWAMATTGQARPDLPAKGFFLMDTTKIPAQIDLDEGIKLELFLEDSGQWFSTSSYSGTKLDPLLLRP